MSPSAAGGGALGGSATQAASAASPSAVPRVHGSSSTRKQRCAFVVFSGLNLPGVSVQILLFFAAALKDFFLKRSFRYACSEQSTAFLKSPFARNKRELGAVNTIQHYTVILDPAEFDGPSDSSIKIVFQKIMLLEDYAFY